MNKKLIIVKLGGSVITEKDDAVLKIRSAVIKSIAKQLAKASKEYRIILVHGAGSFGHPLAKAYNLTQGFTDERSRVGFAETAQSMTNLNSRIVQIINNELPSVGLSPRSFITQTDNVLDPFNTIIVESFLKQNITPVLHGDVVLDNAQGCAILSGDIIIPYLAKKLGAEKVIFLSDVAGVFDDNPKSNPNAKLIPQINAENYGAVLANLKSSGREDVTGEMQGKIVAIRKGLKGIPAFIINGLEKDCLGKILSGGQVGTRLYFN